jgi:hypothetical protein
LEMLALLLGNFFEGYLYLYLINIIVSLHGFICLPPPQSHIITSHHW